MATVTAGSLSGAGMRARDARIKRRSTPGLQVARECGDHDVVPPVTSAVDADRYASTAFGEQRRGSEDSSCSGRNCLKRNAPRVDGIGSRFRQIGRAVQESVAKVRQKRAAANQAECTEDGTGDAESVPPPAATVAPLRRQCPATESRLFRRTSSLSTCASSRPISGAPRLRQCGRQPPTLKQHFLHFVAALLLSHPFHLASLQNAVGKITRVRLPQENELANTCYFTYRMNFIICDQSLSQEEAAEAIKKGECHSDYKIMGADFQMSSDKYVLSDGVPPIEAAFWLIGMPENFQSRTMEECPAIMILSYVVIAEAALFLHGPKNDLSVGFVRDAAVISRTMKYQDTVMNSWAINPAFNAYQRMHSAVLDQVDSGSDLSVNVVVCRCGEESIELLGDRLKLIDRKATKLYVQELCLEETALTLADQARREDAEKAAEIPMTGYLDMALKMATEYYPQTFQNITLTTLASRSCTPILPDDLPLAEYTLFYGETRCWSHHMFLGKPDLELGKNANSRYLDLVFRAMEINTFLVADFLHLGNFRTIADDLTPCQQGIAAQVAEMRGKKGKQPLLSTYRGELFVVKREPLKHVHDMRLGSELCAPEGLGPVWPLLFGKDFLLPVHEDDTSLPTFLRTLDENSTATLPKKISNYLTYVFE